MASLKAWAGAIAAAVGIGVGSTLGVQCAMKEKPGYLAESRTESDGTVVQTWRYAPGHAKAEKGRRYVLIRRIENNDIESTVEVSPGAVKAANAAFIMSGLEQRSDGQYVPRSEDLAPTDVYMRFASMYSPKTVTETGVLVDIVTREGAEHARKLARNRLGAYDFNK